MLIGKGGSGLRGMQEKSGVKVRSQLLRVLFVVVVVGLCCRCCYSINLRWSPKHNFAPPAFTKSWVLFA